jgi:diguanylate cyclase (GGDEF)-like protein
MPEHERVVQPDVHRPALGLPTVEDDVVAMLDLLAETIVQALGFGVAAVNITRPDGTMEAVSVAGNDGARDMLLGMVEGAEVWDQLLALSEPWGRLRFADHRSDTANIGQFTWISDVEPIDATDAWHPEDALFAPLIATDGSRLGILSVDCPHDGRLPGPATRSALEAFAVSAALALEHAALRARAEASEQRYRHLASHDQLTGVGNRSILLDRLEHAVAVRSENRSLLAVVFIDLDRFKSVNDAYSHQAGDEVLKTMARRIGALVRPHDTVVRWGGDEFLILLEQLPDEGVALDVAQRITSSVAEPLDHVARRLRVTASVGVAFGRPSDSLRTDELVRQADAAMYLVKNNGRNDFAVFGAEATSDAERTVEPSHRLLTSGPEAIGCSDGQRPSAAAHADAEPAGTRVRVPAGSRVRPRQARHSG